MPYIIFPSEVIDSPETEPAANVCALDFIHLFGIMCYPNDPTAREKLGDAISAGSIRSLIKRISGQYGNTHEILVDGDLTLRLAGAPDMMGTLTQAIENAALGGALAGNVLGWVVFRGERPETRATASLGSAFRMIEEATRAGHWRGGGTENMKRTIWPTYRPVAHLWAALSMWHDMEGGNFMSARAMLHFLGMAECLRKKGETFVPLRAHAPLLSSEETWKIRPEVAKDWPKFEVQCRDLSAWDLRKRIKDRRDLCK
jgi:hypothetical protein